MKKQVSQKSVRGACDAEQMHLDVLAKPNEPSRCTPSFPLQPPSHQTALFTVESVCVQLRGKNVQGPFVFKAGMLHMETWRNVVGGWVRLAEASIFFPRLTNGSFTIPSDLSACFKLINLVALVPEC